MSSESDENQARLPLKKREISAVNNQAVWEKSNQVAIWIMKIQTVTDWWHLLPRMTTGMDWMRLEGTTACIKGFRIKFKTN